MIRQLFQGKAGAERKEPATFCPGCICIRTKEKVVTFPDGIDYPAIEYSLPNNLKPVENRRWCPLLEVKVG